MVLSHAQLKHKRQDHQTDEALFLRFDINALIWLSKADSLESQ
jgi:hypothetical protein